MKYRGIFEYEYPTEHKPPISIDVHLHGDCVKGKIIEWEYRPLEQEPRKGHWIDTKEISTNRRGQIVHEVICSECSGIAYFRSMGNKYIGANLCPNCGAKMVEPQESESL